MATTGLMTAFAAMRPWRWTLTEYAAKARQRIDGNRVDGQTLPKVCPWSTIDSSQFTEVILLDTLFYRTKIVVS
jgi:hypothetical protein